MAYVGRGIDNISNASILDVISFTNSAGPYNLEKGSAAFTPISVQALVISVDGVIQAPDSYTISAATITFGVSMASSLTNDFIVHNGVGLITEPSDGSVTTAKIEDLAVTAGKLAATQNLSTKTITLPASVSGLGTGITNSQLAGSIDVTSKITGVVPTANLGSGSASSTTILYGDQTYKTEPAEYDDSVVQSNIAMLGFKVAVNGSLTRYNLVDQSIDEFYDTSGVDASASTNEVRTASGSNFYYDGETTSTPTRTQDADDTGVDGDYTWFKWTDTAGTGSYSANANETAEFLVVAGGGGGGAVRGGGGGAGGLRASYGSTSGGGAGAQTDLSFVSGTTYTMTVGAAGTAGVNTVGGGNGGNGGVSSIAGSDIPNVTTVGGGGGLGNTASSNGITGGSGGGMTDNQGPYSASSGTANEGYAGAGSNVGSSSAGGGAAAVGGAGSTSNGGAGGAGLNITITGSTVGYAGGGGGGGVSGDPGGTATHGGGAGATAGGAGTAGSGNTGGGGGGAGDSPPVAGGGLGGSGVVIIRVPTSTVTAGGNLTLQSTDVTAEASPTYGEFVTLIENAYGTATLNTDIKGYVSRDSGSTFTQGTLVDEGTWGTNKQNLGLHDLALGGAASTAMCYKIETLNQSPSSKETRIYATSIGWR